MLFLDYFLSIDDVHTSRQLFDDSFCLSSCGCTHQLTRERVDLDCIVHPSCGIATEKYLLNARRFTILEKDDVGNWTKRKSSQGTETRTIKYY